MMAGCLHPEIVEGDDGPECGECGTKVPRSNREYGDEIAVKIDGVWFHSDPIKDPVQTQHLERMFGNAQEVEEVSMERPLANGWDSETGPVGDLQELADKWRNESEEGEYRHHYADELEDLIQSLQTDGDG